MSDYMLLEYLRNKGIKDDDYKLIDDFKKYMQAKGRGRGMRGSMRHQDSHWDEDYTRHDWDMDYEDSYKARGYMRDSMPAAHINEFEAKEIVSEMYHYDMNKRHTGEHFDMHKAQEVFNKYKDQFGSKPSVTEVYIAINATYHDFCSVLKSWFGSNIDEKVIMLAIVFWFEDDDYKGNKLMDYFM